MMACLSSWVYVAFLLFSFVLGASGGGCYDQNTDYFGNDVNLSTGTTSDRRNSASECQELCKQRRGCQYFTWKQRSNECWLKTQGGSENSGYQAGSTSGPKSCGLDKVHYETTTGNCYEQNTDYFGNDINLSTGTTSDRRSSASECQALCSRRNNCRYFTWKQLSNECWLKTLGGSRYSGYQAGSTSGPKSCGLSTLSLSQAEMDLGDAVTLEQELNGRKEEKKTLFLVKNLKNVDRDAGESLKLRCEAKGDPRAVSFQWHKNGVPVIIEQGRIRIKSNLKDTPQWTQLKINVLETLDTAFYTCEASNGRETVESTAVVRVNLESFLPPFFPEK